MIRVELVKLLTRPRTWITILALNALPTLVAVLLAVTDLDVRHNMGYRRGHVTVGVVVHGDSPMPGHGPGLVPLLCGPAELLRAVPDVEGHVGLTEEALGAPAASTAGRAG